MANLPQKKVGRQSDYNRFYIHLRKDVPLHREAAEILATESNRRNMAGFIAEAVVAYAKMHNLANTSDVGRNRENKHRIKNGQEPLKGEAQERRKCEAEAILPNTISSPAVPAEQSVVVSSSERDNIDVELKGNISCSADEVVVEEGPSGNGATILEDELDLEFFLKGMESLTF